MKKLLLFGIATFATIGAFPQSSPPVIRPKGIIEVKKDHLLKNARLNEKPISALPATQQEQDEDHNRPSPPTNVSWKLLCGSMNTYGMLVSHSRPLQYHPNLNAVSFIHRKSENYTVTPVIPNDALSGVIVAEISPDWGATWDSTCLYSDATNWGRYPQGALYSPSGNTSLNNAFVVGSGVTVNGTSFTGNWYASRKLNAFNNSASTIPGAQQFVSFSLPSYPPGMAAHGWSRCGFSSTDDGVVRSIGSLESDYQTGDGLRGFAILTGTFNGATFDWKIDSIIPPTTTDFDGNKSLLSDPQMAWNQSGTIGYIVGVGQLQGVTHANAGLQPIIYKLDKTTNASATWSLMPAIDFNSPAMRPLVISRFDQNSQIHTGLAGVDTIMTASGIDTVGIPRTEQIDIAVDIKGDLHIGLVFSSQPLAHRDSLNYYTTFTVQPNPTEKYRWRHVNGSRPILYDFIGNGNSPWKALLVDSMSSEGASASPEDPGYLSNPWDPDNDGLKLETDARLQLGRTPNGDLITFSWAESDSLLTDDSYKWNNLPDLKVRAVRIRNGAHCLDLGKKQNLTKNGNNSVKNRATLHYLSPTTGPSTVPIIEEPTDVPITYTVDVNVPHTVTNSNPYSQTTNNRTWYGAAKVTFAFDGWCGRTFTIGVNEFTNSLSSANIYPNPAQNSAIVELKLETSSVVEIKLTNVVGQQVKTLTAQGLVGENKLPLDLSGLSQGIYFVDIKVGKARAVKKLVVE